MGFCREEKEQMPGGQDTSILVIFPFKQLIQKNTFVAIFFVRYKHAFYDSIF